MATKCATGAEEYKCLLMNSKTIIAIALICWLCVTSFVRSSTVPNWVHTFIETQNRQAQALEKYSLVSYKTLNDSISVITADVSDNLMSNWTCLWVSRNQKVQGEPFQLAKYCKIYKQSKWTCTHQAYTSKDTITFQLQFVNTRVADTAKLDAYGFLKKGYDREYVELINDTVYKVATVLPSGEIRVL